MIYSYFVIALRNLLKQKTFSFIKIAGLAFGLATSIVIFLYILEDLSYDKFHPNHNNIVRLLTIDNAEGVSSKLVAVTQPRLGPAAKEELPEVIESVRFTAPGNTSFAMLASVTTASSRAASSLGRSVPTSSGKKLPLSRWSK